jgi:hypothetical protein
MRGVDEDGRQGAGGDGGIGERVAEEQVNKKQGQAGHFLFASPPSPERVELKKLNHFGRIKELTSS